ncbi:MAG: nucleotidyltransferase family protein [Planctomycetales bacterium]|nr:nucleotidyltransferase family protein [Planctomycetales bacterium]
MTTLPSPLLAVLRTTKLLAELSLSDWDRLLVDARETRLLGSLVAEVDRLGVADRLPTQIAWHLEASRVENARHEQITRYETACLARTLKDIDTPIILLKGAAYRLLDLPPAAGRISGDLDLLVRRERLAEVETALRADGWVEGEMDERQQAYYRHWMHEIPPLMHRERGTKLDVHHNILPATDNLQVDPAKLLDAATPISGHERLFALSPADMVLHGAAHLFRNGHYEAGLRDLVDFDRLLRHFSTDPTFCEALARRASELQLGLPLALALRYAQQILTTEVPAALKSVARQQQPNLLLLAALDRLVPKAVLPPARQRVDRLRLASHWILARYPLSLWKKSVLPKVQRIMLPARPKERASN